MITTHVRPARRDVRTAIIAAASELFRQQGYTATTLDQVAAAAGFTKGAIYSNFGGKPELMGAAIAEWFPRRASSAIQAATLLEAGRTDELARQLAELVLTDTWSLLMNEFRAVAQRDEAVSEIYTRVRREHQTLLADQLRSSRGGLGLSADVDPDAAAVLLITVISGLVADRAAAPSTITRAVVEASMEQLLRGLRP